jgi:outer membrane protein assembly factor BamB
MHRSRIIRWGILWACAAAFPLAAGASAEDDVIKPARPLSGAATLAEIGEQQFSRLPWESHIVRANLSKDKPVALVGAYVMNDDLVCVSLTGLIYCLSRRDLTPRWVSSLKGPLAKPPAEGPTHYAFVVQTHDGAFWLQALAKRNGAEANGFPARLPFAVSSGLSVNGSFVFVGSLGSPRDATTVEAYSLADGEAYGGMRTRALVWATPTTDPTGNLLVVAIENGTTQAVDAEGNGMWDVAWTLPGTGPIAASPNVTPQQVLIGSQDGILRSVDLGSGQVNWLEGLELSIDKRPWVLGSMTKVKRASGVEGASEIEVDVYTGIAFARTRKGLYAFDLETGKALFHEPRFEARPIAKQGRWVLTMDREHRLLVRDAQDEYRVKGRLDLRMFDLVPTNEGSGQLFGVTSDGMVVLATPK